jgi:diguanylate cyclase (GGDEF)-like protein
MVRSGLPLILRAVALLATCLSLIALWHLCDSLYRVQNFMTLLLIYIPLSVIGTWSLLCYFQVVLARERAAHAKVDEERVAAIQICRATIESLAYAVEARTPHNLGHLSRVQALTEATARAMNLKEDAIEGMRIASLLHDIGRLGVPDSILSKEGVLTEFERERVRLYPVLGSRILAAIPFSWPIVPIVRHHREHFDGSGYPDGLKGKAIPLGARILAVADVYDALTSSRSHRPGNSHEEALAYIEEGSGTLFDPEVVCAFQSVVDDVRARFEQSDWHSCSSNAAMEIARAQMEMRALYDLACEVGSTLQLDATLETLVKRLPAIVSCSTCVIFLIESGDENLRAYCASGVNQAFFYNSLAQMGTYLTGRVASRGEPTLASYMADDLWLNLSPSEPWIPLRSTLIVPLRADGRVIGTINLYHTEPDAFHPDDVRVMVCVGEMAGRAVRNAHLFSQAQETAYTDALTGLRNVRYLKKFLEQELNRAQKNQQQLAILNLDLDGFKQVNDNYGHARGDEVLREIGQILRAVVRNYDLVARYAGDEFAIVLPESNREKAGIVAAKVRGVIDRYGARLRQSDPNFPQIGVSIGISIYPEDASSLNELMSCADQQMYDNKRSRRAA